MPTHRDSPHTHAALVKRVVLLRARRDGRTNDPAKLDRRLSRVRAESAALRAQLTTHPSPAAVEPAVR